MRAEKCIVQFVYKGNIIFELYNTQNKHHTPAAPVVCKKEYICMCTIMLIFYLWFYLWFCCSARATHYYLVVSSTMSLLQNLPGQC